MSHPISLEGKKGLVIGIASGRRIACGCAKVMRALGAEVAVTHLKEKAQPHVPPLGEALRASLHQRCDVEQAGDIEGVSEQISRCWGRLDSPVSPRRLCAWGCSCRTAFGTDRQHCLRRFKLPPLWNERVMPTPLPFQTIDDQGSSQ